MHSNKRNIELLEKLQNPVFYYNGILNFEMLVVLGNSIRNMASTDNRAGKKLHKIFVELAQNIGYYSSERQATQNGDIGSGIVALDNRHDSFKFFCGNLIKYDEGDVLSHRIELINNLNKEGLRDLKRQIRMSNKDVKLSAHIGVIHSALISENKLFHEILPVNENFSFFKLGVTIKKEKAFSLT